MPGLDDALRTIDDRLTRFSEERGAPGLAWGVIHDGALVHAGGAGVAVHGTANVPDADTVFRIASMTKSFTAATILLLRDEGRLRLDDPVALHVPPLAGWHPPTTDADPVTIRQLLTMSAGLATDDPWGDRQQSLPLDAFARLLEAGPTFGWPPGTAFDYSNLGYGILGRVVTAAGGAEYRDVVRDRLLVPLGLASTAFDEEDVPADRLAHGYVRRGDDLVREGQDGYGALASMGGLYSSVRDLAGWIGGFLDAFPARSDPEGPHPLRRASRREMQQVQRGIATEVPAHRPDAPRRILAGGYGFGLFVTSDPELGTVVGHSGGYPGYGSNMAWHPATGLGLVALANLRYAATSGVVSELLAGLVRDEVVPRRRVRPSPAVERYRDVAEALVAHWDDAAADAAFAVNMDLDEPRADRRAAAEAASLTLGTFRRDPGRPAVSSSPAELTWWLRGSDGWARLELLVSPEPEPRIQSLKVVYVADPSPALVAAARALLAVATDGEAETRWPRWPAGLARAPDLDAVAVERSLAAGRARFGSLALGLPAAGDGTSSATWELATERGGRATLRVSLDPESGEVIEATLLAARQEPPDEAW